MLTSLEIKIPNPIGKHNQSVSKTYDGDQWVNMEVLVLGDSLFTHIVEGDTVNDDAAADSLDGDEGLDWLFSDAADIIFLDPDGETESVE